MAEFHFTASVSVLILRVLDHSHSVMAYWDTLTEQSHLNVISNTYDFPCTRSQNVCRDY